MMMCVGEQPKFMNIVPYNPFPNRNDSMKRQLTQVLSSVSTNVCFACMFQGVKSGLKLINQIKTAARMVVVQAIGPSVPSRASKCPSIDVAVFPKRCLTGPLFVSRKVV